MNLTSTRTFTLIVWALVAVFVASSSRAQTPTREELCPPSAEDLKEADALQKLADSTLATARGYDDLARQALQAESATSDPGLKAMWHQTYLARVAERDRLKELEVALTDQANALRSPKPCPAQSAFLSNSAGATGPSASAGKCPTAAECDALKAKWETAQNATKAAYGKLQVAQNDTIEALGKFGGDVTDTSHLQAMKNVEEANTKEAIAQKAYDQAIAAESQALSAYLNCQRQRDACPLATNALPSTNTANRMGGPPGGAGGAAAAPAAPNTPHQGIPNQNTAGAENLPPAPNLAAPPPSTTPDPCLQHPSNSGCAPSHPPNSCGGANEPQCAPSRSSICNPADSGCTATSRAIGQRPASPSAGYKLTPERAEEILRSIREQGPPNMSASSLGECGSCIDTCGSDQSCLDSCQPICPTGEMNSPSVRCGGVNEAQCVPSGPSTCNPADSDCHATPPDCPPGQTCNPQSGTDAPIPNANMIGSAVSASGILFLPYTSLSNRIIYLPAGTICPGCDSTDALSKSREYGQRNDYITRGPAYEASQKYLACVQHNCPELYARLLKANPSLAAGTSDNAPITPTAPGKGGLDALGKAMADSLRNDEPAVPSRPPAQEEPTTPNENEFNPSETGKEIGRGGSGASGDVVSNAAFAFSSVNASSIYLFPVGINAPDYSFTTTYNGKPVPGAEVKLSELGATPAIDSGTGAPLAPGFQLIVITIGSSGNVSVSAIPGQAKIQRRLGFADEANWRQAGRNETHFRLASYPTSKRLASPDPTILRRVLEGPRSTALASTGFSQGAKAELLDPAGANLAPAAESANGQVRFSIVANGNSSGEVFQLQAIDPSGHVKQIEVPEGMVVEPVKPGSVKPVAESTKSAKGNLLTRPVSGYCLEYAKEPPASGMLYRIAPQALQEKYRPTRSVLQAGRELAAAGKLHPDSEAQQYVDAIRQYALWSKLEGWDVQKFAEMFTERTKKNAQAMNVKWTQQMEQAVRSLAPSRWRDISMVLEEAEKLAQKPAHAAASQPTLELLQPQAQLPNSVPELRSALSPQLDSDENARKP